MSVRGAPPGNDVARTQIQQDWANREYVEVITTNIKRITDFLNQFGMHNKRGVFRQTGTYHAYLHKTAQSTSSED